MNKRLSLFTSVSLFSVNTIFVSPQQICYLSYQGLIETDEKCLFLWPLNNDVDFYPGYSLMVTVAWLCNSLSVAAEIQVWVHDYTEVGGFISLW